MMSGNWCSLGIRSTNWESEVFSFEWREGEAPVMVQTKDFKLRNCVFSRREEKVNKQITKITQKKQKSV